jgi:hypothetical protein
MPAWPASAAKARIETDPIEIIMASEAGRISIGILRRCRLCRRRPLRLE